MAEGDGSVRPPKPQKHHYIPQFYLRPWVNADGKLEEYGRVPPSNQIRSRRRGTLSTGYVPNLYTLPGTTNATRQNVERLFFGTVDTDAALARRKLLAGDTLSEIDRYRWARFILSLILRNPEEVNKLKARVNQIYDQPDSEIQEQYTQVRASHFPATVEEAFRQQFPEAPDRTAILINAQLIQDQKVMRTVAEMMWSVIRTEGASRRLLTSDRRVVMTNGLMRPDGHICLPIGPRHLFVACTIESMMERFHRLPKSKLVRECNAQLIGQARLHVYGWDKSELATVRRGMSSREHISLVKAFESSGDAI